MKYIKYGFSKTTLYASLIPLSISLLIGTFTHDYSMVWLTVFFFGFHVMVFFLLDLCLEMIFNEKEKE